MLEEIICDADLFISELKEITKIKLIFSARLEWKNQKIRSILNSNGSNLILDFLTNQQIPTRYAKKNLEEVS
ncbi:MAG: hypothetical protein R3A12_11860 [Ignavibacteria bacterium]